MAPDRTNLRPTETPTPLHAHPSYGAANGTKGGPAGGETNADWREQLRDRVKEIRARRLADANDSGDLDEAARWRRRADALASELKGSPTAELEAPIAASGTLPTDPVVVVANPSDPPRADQVPMAAPPELEAPTPESEIIDLVDALIDGGMEDGFSDRSPDSVDALGPVPNAMAHIHQPDAEPIRAEADGVEPVSDAHGLQSTPQPPAEVDVDGSERPNTHGNLGDLDLGDLREAGSIIGIGSDAAATTRGSSTLLRPLDLMADEPTPRIGTSPIEMASPDVHRSELAASLDDTPLLDISTPLADPVPFREEAPPEIEDLLSLDDVLEPLPTLFDTSTDRVTRRNEDTGSDTETATHATDPLVYDVDGSLDTDLETSPDLNEAAIVDEAAVLEAEPPDPEGTASTAADQAAPANDPMTHKGDASWGDADTGFGGNIADLPAWARPHATPRTRLDTGLSSLPYQERPITRPPESSTDDGSRGPLLPTARTAAAVSAEKTSERGPLDGLEQGEPVDLAQPSSTQTVPLPTTTASNPAIGETPLPASHRPAALEATASPEADNVAFDAFDAVMAPAVAGTLLDPASDLGDHSFRAIEELARATVAAQPAELVEMAELDTSAAQQPETTSAGLETSLQPTPEETAPSTGSAPAESPGSAIDDRLGELAEYSPDAEDTHLIGEFVGRTRMPRATKPAPSTDDGHSRSLSAAQQLLEEAGRSFGVGDEIEPSMYLSDAAPAEPTAQPLSAPRTPTESSTPPPATEELVSRQSVDLPSVPEDRGERERPSVTPSPPDAIMGLDDPEGYESAPWGLGDPTDSDAERVGDPHGDLLDPSAPVSDRVFSVLCDSLVLAAIGLLLMFAAANAAGTGAGQVVANAPVPFAVAWVLFGLVYGVMFVGTTGQTLGKMAMNVRVIGSDRFRVGYGQAAIRALGYTAAALPLGLGLLPALRDPQHRGLHDRLSGTRVVKA